MMCFRDRTFCNFYNECADGSTCSRALTEKVLQDATKWWGSKDAPISMYIEKPKCFKQNEKGNNL